MTMMTLKIDDDKQELVDAFKVFISNFRGVSYEISNEDTKADILNSLSSACKDIKNGKAIQEAKPINELFKEFSND